jgi:cytochrome d ubiquinol oxidase subunit II
MSTLGGLLVFLLFVQGGQSMLFSLSKNEDEKKLLINTLGRKWEYTFTTLVTFGAAFFAAFPLFYSTSFSGAYWVWMLILFCFVLQAVSYNGMLGTFLLGVAVATFFTGSEFTVNKGNITGMGSLGLVISQWQSPWMGLEALANFRNWCLGLAVLFLARTLASLYFVNRLNHKTLENRSRKFVLYNGIPFILFFLIFLIWTLVSDGFAVDPDTEVISMSKNKYFNNFLDMPVVSIFFLLGVVGVLFGIFATVFNPNFKKGIVFAGTGTVLTVMMLLLVAGFNNTAYYPSTIDLQSSLTLQSSSSSEFTLQVLSVVSLLLPVVVGYIIYAWRALEKKKLGLDDLKSDGHSY